MFDWFFDIFSFRELLFQGLLQTLMLLGLSLIGGMLLGWILLGLRQLPFGLGYIASGLVYFNRNIPLIMLIALIHYGLMPLTGIQMEFFVSAWVALSISSGAYFAEIFRAGFKSLSKEEKESAQVVGLSVWQQWLWVLIPLVFLRMMPNILNQTASLVKDTSLAGLIGVIELTRAGEIVYENTFQEFPILIMVGTIYFLIGYGFTRLGERFKLKATLS